MNKGAALRMICEKKEIRKEDTIAFGDQEPDIPIETLKERADFVTRTNNEAGIAYAVRQYLNGDDLK